MTRISHIIALVLLALLICPTNADAQKRKKTDVKAKQDSLTILNQLANSGDAAAQNTLANWYYAGKNVERDYSKAAHWWSLAAKKQNPDAVGNLALCYQLGRGLKADSAKAIGLYQKAIELGNKLILPQHEKLADGKKGSLFSAQLLYQCYSRGIGVSANEEKADKYLGMLADAGNAEYQYNVALGYLNWKKPDKAVPWLKKAAKKGNIGAIFYLGRMMYRGTGIQQDREQGIALMTKAADSGLPGACLEMGKIYLAGDDVKRDAKKGAAYLSNAAGISGEAGWTLAKCYLKGDGVEKDYYQAAQWMAEYAGSHKKDIAKLLDDDNSQVFKQYLEGLHHYYIEKDYDAALKVFKLVAKEKIDEGVTMQALCLANKNYARNNDKKAAKLMAKAASTSSLAKYHMATMLFKGQGVKKDKEKAVELLKSAAEEGIAEAQCELADRYMEGKDVTQDYVKAAKLYLKAETQHKLTPDAARNLAKCYQLKVSALPDLNKAKERIEQLKATKTVDRLQGLLRMVAD